MIHFTTFYEYLKKNNVELISVCEGLMSSRKEHQMIFGIMCSVAEFEKDTINFRLHNGRKTKVRNNERGFGGRIPFGYKRIDGDLITDGNAEVVKYIFKKTNQLNKRNLTKTKKTQTLLKLLKDRGFTFNGKDFKNWNIKNILTNPFYVGDLNYSGIQTTHKYERIISRRLFNHETLYIKTLSTSFRSIISFSFSIPSRVSKPPLATSTIMSFNSRSCKTAYWVSFSVRSWIEVPPFSSV